MLTLTNPLKKVKTLLKRVNSYGEIMAALTDQELIAKTQAFKERLAKGESLDDLLPEAYAVVREADQRVLGMFPYDVQVMGAIVMHQGNIAEMSTGEGKTLTATMPIYLNALTGDGAILVTTNDYLAKRDAEEMGKVYTFLGLTIGVPLADDGQKLEVEEKLELYASDIVYTTNSALGFDYLIDNLASSAKGKFMRAFNYAIIDEADAVLLDSAQTPLIISGAPRVQSNYYDMINTLMTTLVEGQDYVYQEETNHVWLTTQGAKAAESYLGIDNLYARENSDFARHLIYALRAHKLFKKDKDYIIRQGGKGPEVILLDKATGRLMELTKLQGGLHQAIEAKELVQLSPETRAMASITYQSLFKKFQKIAGMTGTGKTAEKEFLETYGMQVIQIPTNRPKKRVDYPDQLYITLPEKVFASMEYVKHYHEKGNPLLIFTGSVEMSEVYSSLLLREGIAHNLLNANNVAREAQMIAESGQLGAVTVATSMAGRGTDIKLGSGVAELGGLVVIGTERMESQRIDLQIRGRSGRQGDPGMSKFFVSLEDDVIKRFGPSWVHDYYKDYRVEDQRDATQLSGLRYHRLVEKAQEASDSAGRANRRQTLEYAESMNIQRELIYAQRDQLIYSGTNLDGHIETVLDDFIDLALSEEDFWTRPGLYHFILSHISFQINGIPDDLDLNDPEQVAGLIYQYAFLELDAKQAYLDVFGLTDHFKRLALLKAIDDNWIEQVDYLQQLQQAIRGQQANQKNPIVTYYQEAYAGFEAMKKQIKKDMVRNLLLSQVTVTKEGDIITHFP